ncbi:MAG: MliC family protein [Cyanobacteriota bacterium]|nr:MliC family protein [Cyanobacteriota bacterium]
MPPRSIPGALLSAVLTLTAASATAARAEEPIRANYLCSGRFDATEVRALFFNGQPSEVVLLSGSEGASRLLQQPSGSGARYGDDNEQFWIKGDQASWQRGRARTLQCKLSSGSQGPTR